MIIPFFSPSTSCLHVFVHEANVMNRAWEKQKLEAEIGCERNGSLQGDESQIVICLLYKAAET